MSSPLSLMPSPVDAFTYVFGDTAVNADGKGEGEETQASDVVENQFPEAVAMGDGYGSDTASASDESGEDKKTANDAVKFEVGADPKDSSHHKEKPLAIVAERLVEVAIPDSDVNSSNNNSDLYEAAMNDESLEEMTSSTEEP